MAEIKTSCSSLISTEQPKCQNKVNIVAMYFVDAEDVKQIEPFKMKRKYGKRKRTIHKFRFK